MKLEYTIKKNEKLTKETIKTCDDGAKGMQGVLIETTKVVKPYFVPIMWVLTRFYKREITKEKIIYDFYLV